MNVLCWHVHGSWMTAFVRGPHRYFVPLVPGRGPDGRGRAQTFFWPDNAIEVDEATSRTMHYDVVVFQRMHEVEHLAPRFLGNRIAGHDLPAVFVEHDAPEGRIDDMHHPIAGRRGFTLAHVTHFNALFWNAPDTDVRVIEHGIVDPGYRYTGELSRAVAVINEPVRRARRVGADLLARFTQALPVDVFGMGASAIGGYEDVPQERLHDQVARRRVYVHPNRWTSLGLSLIEAMHVGLPVVAVATTEAFRAVPREAGACSTDVDELIEAARAYVAHPELARETGVRAREYARERFGIERFTSDWDDVLRGVAE